MIELLDKAPEDKDKFFNISVSKIKTFQDCKLKYKFCYIDKLPRQDRDFHIFGKFVHEILENFHKELLENPHFDIKKLMGTCFNNSSKKWLVTLDQKKEAHSILTQYLSKFADTVKASKEAKVLGLEKQFIVNIDNKVLLNGFIDKYQQDKDDIHHVIDYKTTKDKKYLKDFFQLMTYAFVVFLENPELNKIRTSYLLLRHDCSSLEKEFGDKDVASIKDKYLQYADEMLEERLFRPSPSKMCSYCDYLPKCNVGKEFLKPKDFEIPWSGKTDF